jgi:hypothetical protein
MSHVQQFFKTLQIYLQIFVAWALCLLFTVILVTPFMLSSFVSCILLLGHKSPTLHNTAAEPLLLQGTTSTFSDKSRRWSVYFFMAADLSALCKFLITVFNMALRLNPENLIHCTPKQSNMFTIQAYSVKQVCEATIDVASTLQSWKVSALALSALFIVVSIVNISKRVIRTRGSVESTLQQLEIPEQEAEDFIVAYEKEKAEIQRCQTVHLILNNKSCSEFVAMGLCHPSAMKVFNHYKQEHALKSIGALLGFISDESVSSESENEITRNTKIAKKRKQMDDHPGAQTLKGKSIDELVSFGFTSAQAVRCSKFFECAARGENFRAHFRDFNKLSFHGQILGNATKCICSFPGIYEAEWKEGVSSICSACVFYSDDEKQFYGEHSKLLKDELFGKLQLRNGDCYCRYLYPDKEQRSKWNKEQAPWGEL